MKFETYEAPQLVLLGEAESLVQGFGGLFIECVCGFSRVC